jgi:hypothetical protein
MPIFFQSRKAGERVYSTEDNSMDWAKDTFLETSMRSTSLQDPLDRGRAEEVTKSIRSKAFPIETQLQNARRLFDGTTKVFLPGKHEFVLEWILEKLKTDKSTE